MYLVLDKYDTVAFSKGVVIVIAIIIALIAIGLYLLRSFGVYKLAKNKKVDSYKLAFIPCLWVYPLCMVIKDCRFFNVKFSKIAFFFTLIFTLSFVIDLVIDFLCYFPLVGYYFQGGEIYLATTDTVITGYSLYPLSSSYIYVKNLAIPYDAFTVSMAVNILGWISSIASLFCLVVNVNLFIALFKTYSPSNYILFTILSVFGFVPFTLFIVRNKKPTSYAEYLRSRYYDPYANRPQTPNQNRPVEPENPFTEFSDGKNNGSTNNSQDPNYGNVDPFEEFSKKDK